MTTKPISFQLRTELIPVQEGKPKTVKLYLYDDITEYGEFNWQTWEYDESETSANFIKNQIDSLTESNEIELFVNSYGGSVKEGVAIYNMLKRSPAHKTCYIDGFAYSVASLICLACDHIVMGLGTSMMIHDMWVECSGNATELRKIADDLDVLMEANRKIYLNRSKNLTEEQIKEMMANETYLTPEQCVEYGFADEISEKREEHDAKANNQERYLQTLNQELKNRKTFESIFKELVSSVAVKSDLSSNQTEKRHILKQKMMKKFKEAHNG